MAKPKKRNLPLDIEFVAYRLDVHLEHPDPYSAAVRQAAAAYREKCARAPELVLAHPDTAPHIHIPGLRVHEHHTSSPYVVFLA